MKHSNLKRNGKCTFTKKRKYFKCKSKYGNWLCKGNQCSKKFISKMKKECCRSRRRH